MDTNLVATLSVEINTTYRAIKKELGNVKSIPTDMISLMSRYLKGPLSLS